MKILTKEEEQEHYKYVSTGISLPTEQLEAHNATVPPFSEAQWAVWPVLQSVVWA